MNKISWLCALFVPPYARIVHALDLPRQQSLCNWVFLMVTTAQVCRERRSIIVNAKGMVKTRESIGITKAAQINCDVTHLTRPTSSTFESCQMAARRTRIVRVPQVRFTLFAVARFYQPSTTIYLFPSTGDHFIIKEEIQCSLTGDGCN